MSHSLSFVPGNPSSVDQCECCSAAWGDEDDDFGTFVSAPDIPPSAASPRGPELAGDFSAVQPQSQNIPCQSTHVLDHESAILSPCHGQIFKGSSLSRFATECDDIDNKSLAGIKIVGLDDFSAFQEDSISGTEGMPHIGNLSLQNMNSPGSDSSTECLDRDRTAHDLMGEKKPESAIIDSGVFSSDLSLGLNSESWSSSETDKAVQSDDNSLHEQSQGSVQEPLAVLQQETTEAVVHDEENLEEVWVCSKSQTSNMQREDLVSDLGQCDKDTVAQGSYDNNTSDSHSSNNEIQKRLKREKENSQEWAVFKTHNCMNCAITSQSTQGTDSRQLSGCDSNFTPEKETSHSLKGQTYEKPCAEPKSGCDDKMMMSGIDNPEDESQRNADWPNPATAKHYDNMLTGPILSTQSTQKLSVCWHAQCDSAVEDMHIGLQTSADPLKHAQNIPDGSRDSGDCSVTATCAGSSHSHIYNKDEVVSKKETCHRDGDDFGDFSSNNVPAGNGDEDDFGDFSTNNAAASNDGEDFGDFSFNNVPAGNGDEDDFGDFSTNNVAASNGDEDDFGDFSAHPMSWQAKAQSSSNSASNLGLFPRQTADDDDDGDTGSASGDQYGSRGFGDFSEQAGSGSFAVDSDWANFAAPSGKEKDDSSGLFGIESAEVKWPSLSTDAEKVRWSKFEKPLLHCFPGYSAPVSCLPEGTAPACEDNTGSHAKTAEAAAVTENFLHQGALETVLKQDGQSLPGGALETVLKQDGQSLPGGALETVLKQDGQSLPGGALETVLKQDGQSLPGSGQQQTGQQLSEKPGPGVVLWGGLQDVNGSPAVGYRWAKSSSKSHLLHTLRINTQNMLIGHKKQPVPVYTTGLSLLESPNGRGRERGGGGGGMSAPVSTSLASHARLDHQQQGMKNMPQVVVFET